MVGKKSPPQRRTSQQSQEPVEFSEPVQPAQPVEFSEPAEATDSRESDEQLSEESEVVEQEVTPVPPSSDNPEDPEVVASAEVDLSERASLQQLVQEVLAGKWGNGEQRRHLLTQAGHDYDQVQQAVNWRLGGGAPAAYKSSVEEVAAEVIAGHWGEGARLRANLEGAGYIFNQVQAEVDRQSK